MKHLVILCAFAATPALAQPAPPCHSPPAAAFDHMLGEWFGVQYTYQGGDTTLVGTTELRVEKTLDGCVHEELMDIHMVDGAHLFNAIGLRSYDVFEERWRFTEVDDRGRHLTFEGRADDGTWRFYIERERDGRVYLLRLSYPSVDADHFQQVFERSYDAGATWERWTHIDFIRDRPGLH